MSCCTSDYSSPLQPILRNPDCIPIPIAKNDPFYPKRNIECLNFVRLQPILEVHCNTTHSRVVNIYRITVHDEK